MALVTNGTAISVAAFKSLPFDPVKDFEPVSMVGTFDLVFVVNSESEYKTLWRLHQGGEGAAGKLNIGTIAVGGTQNLGAELFQSMADPQRADCSLQEFARQSWWRSCATTFQMQVDFPPAVQGSGQ
jgi:tripartite-type tricarboxylate transporter receptor subunit TctC